MCDTYSSLLVQLYKTNGVLRRRCVGRRRGRGVVGVGGGGWQIRRGVALPGNRKSFPWRRPPKNIRYKGTGLIVSQIMRAGVSNCEISECVHSALFLSVPKHTNAPLLYVAEGGKLFLVFPSSFRSIYVNISIGMSDKLLYIYRTLAQNINFLEKPEFDFRELYFVE